jgi:uroporphyrinogen decarboxylase
LRIIGFPRAAPTEGIARFAAAAHLDAISIDTASDLAGIARLDGLPTLQGNLDPIALVAGGAALDSAIDAILDIARTRPFIFNLGHGILPQTPIAHVEHLLRRVRAI